MRLLALLTALCASCAVGPVVDKAQSQDDTDLVDTDVVGADTDPPVVDTGPGVVDTDVADTDVEDTGPIGITRFEITLTADDAWTMWIDGQPVAAPGQFDWRVADTVTVEVPGQRHVVAIHSYDQLNVIAGLIGKVVANGELIALTGDGQWVTTGTTPDPSWIDRRFDDSAWGRETRCTTSEEAVWGRGIPEVAAMLDEGAHWQWSRACRSLGESWFRLHVGDSTP